MPKDKMRLGDLLVSVGKITENQLQDALSTQKISKKKLGEVLVESGYVTETDIIEVLEFQLGIPKVDLQTYEIEAKVPNLIPENLARRHNVIPVRYKGDTITVAMDDPLNIYAVDDIEIATDLNVQPVISTKDDIERAIEFYYSNKSAEKALEDFNKQHQTVEENDVVNEDISNAPAVRLVNSLIKQAVRAKASDIHIEPFKYHVRIRFRVDGQLQEIMSPAKSTFSAIITRVKIMGNMDIAEKRIPQDGRIEVNIEGRSIDLRISTLPTVYGEKVVMRLLDRSSFLLSKDELGFTKENLSRFNNIIHNPHGVILVTGPTGSGKTTTLYTVLRELNNIDKNIVTVEDPVEYKLDGISQVQVNKKAGLTFANGLRSILRQDPDIVMIGEIRDTETAQIAIRSAITGHLVLSTMHTNSAPATVSRLLDMDIQTYLISSSVVGIVAQRLVRRICNKCKHEYEPSLEVRKELGLNKGVKLYKGLGCNACLNTGYKGRIAIHEILSVTESIRKLINEKASIDEIKKEAINGGMITLSENCVELVKKGITTVEEFERINYTME